MRGKYSVSDAEWEVLKMLWSYGESIRQPQLLELFEKEGKMWKRQTLNTFLSRLEEKGLVKRENRIVTPVFSEEEYGVLEMREVIDNLYGGRVSSFLAAFLKRDAVEEEDLAELRRLLEQSGK